MKPKPTVMISFVEGGENGGPYISHKRILESILQEKYNFIPLYLPKGRLGILNIKVINKIRKDILKVNPDIIHVGGLQLSGFHLVLASKLARFDNIVLAVHGSSSEAMHFSKLKRFILKRMEIFTIKKSKAIYGVSDYVAKWELINDNSKNSFGRIYNLPPNINQPVELGKNIRKELNINSKTLIITSTGRITKEKGFEVLAEAIKKLKSTIDIKFLIVGKGNYLEEMKENLKVEIKERKVIFLGYRTDIDEILSASNIFVLCTFHETLSISLLEAAKHGLPLIATDVGGVPEIIKDEYNGILTKKGDTVSVINAINRLIVEEKDRIKFGENSQGIVSEKFSNKNILMSIDSLYRSILNDRY